MKRSFHQHRHAAGGRARAFTLIELLVVTGVILILAGITFALAGRINASAKSRATENIIRGLDQVLAEYQIQKGAVPAFVTTTAGEVLDQRVQRDGLPAFTTAALSPIEAAVPITFPLVDGRMREVDDEGREFPIGHVDSTTSDDVQRYDRDLDPPQPAAALFLLEASRYTAVDALLKSMGTTYVDKSAHSAWGWTDANANITQFDVEPTNDGGGRRPVYLTTVRDAWGRPIRFAHPAFQGGSGDYFDTTAAAFVARTRLTVRGPVGAQEVMIDRSYQPYNLAVSPATDWSGRPIGAANPTGDGDEGRLPSGRAYFYSAGPEGNPGARRTNVYLDGARPEFPAETARFAAD
ncbi:MAG: type II secretion system protein [Phycisphaerales bacterium]